LWILPLSIAYFNRFPLHTVPFNIAALALITPLTLFGFTAAVLSLFFPTAALWLVRLTRPLVDALLFLAHWGESMRWAQWNLASPSAWQLIAMYSALFAVLFVLARFKKRPLYRGFSQRTLLLGLLPLFLLLAGLCIEKFQRERQNVLDLLPLSVAREACLIQSASAGSILLLPERLRFGEARTVSDFLRHRHVTHVRALVLIPDDPATSGRQGPNYLKTILSDIRVDQVLGGNASSQLSALNHSPVMSPKVQVFVPTGLDVQLADLHFVGVPQAFRVQAGAFCLLEKHPESVSNQASDLSPCALHWLAGKQTRLVSSSSTPEMDARRYYHIKQHNELVFVYSEK
jgi:Competence protein